MLRTKSKHLSSARGAALYVRARAAEKTGLLTPLLNRLLAKRQSGA
jgi:hypothetical protein